MKKRKWRWLFVISLCILSIWLLASVRPILSPFFLALALAYMLAPVVEILTRKGVGRKTSIAIVFLGIIGSFAITIFLLIPKLYLELSKLTLVLPETMAAFEQKVQDFRSNFQAAGLPHQVITLLDEHLVQGQDFMMKWLDDILDDIPKILTSMGLLILSPVIAIYLLVDWEKIQGGLLRIVPQRKRVAWQRVIQDISHIVRSYIRGNILVALIVGILTGVGVKIAGMDYALIIGVLCGLFDLIPYFGPLIGAIPAVLLGLVISPFMAIKVLIVILIVQQLESSIISPKLMGDSVGLHPLWIIFALLAGGEVAGFWGILLAVPVAAVIRVIIRHIYFWLVSPEMG
ncbi:MAG: AI-2E family transporter [Desulfitobacterium sp.]|nr:AI-2E family transporter [Desulfitobacterium sp.]